MPLVQEQVEHLARPIRSKVSPKEKKSLTSKVNTDVVHLDPISDCSNSVSTANEAARKVGGDIVINIQANNFGLKGTLLDRVINNLKVKPQTEYATLGRRITDANELFDPNDNIALSHGRVPFFWLFILPEDNKVLDLLIRSG